MAALAQNGDGFRTDQASAADDDDLHDLPSLVDKQNAATRKIIRVRRNGEKSWTFNA